jgi:hypothetical protein
VLDVIVTRIPVRMPASARGQFALMVLAAFLVLNHLGAFGSGTPELVYKGF